MLIDDDSTKKLNEIKNKRIIEIVEKYAKICRPEKVTIITDSQQDAEYIRKKALENKEESELLMKGHTVHFDGYYDQGRDRENTKILLSKGGLGKNINTGNRDRCISEIMKLLDGIMAGKEMFVRFFCLGPENSLFTLYAMQITDSAYVCHAESLLYRDGYEAFKNMKHDDFFYFIHSAGEIENGISKNFDKKRIYIDINENCVFSVNTQYAGNSVGLKKLAFRLSINKAHNEGWLSEHMFIMGVRPEGKKRTTYFCGAFPSACGKTSTAMIPGQSIVGDDLAYLRICDLTAHAVNPEKGIFGIIQDVNPKDDPLIHKVLTTEREIIFSNVLVHDGRPYWLGMDEQIPNKGINFSGSWFLGKKDKDNSEIQPAHKNARYAINLEELDNVDKHINEKEGVAVDGIIYGCRDSDTMPPVVEALSWNHGVFMGASIESETTAATIGKEGLRRHDPMAIADFLSVPVGLYISNHFKFGSKLVRKPKIFSTNYFLKDDGKYVNDKTDKKVWLIWMESRVNNEFKALETPIGFIPKYEDLKQLFRTTLNKEYSKNDYEKQFSLRISKLLEKIDRIEKIYEEDGAPAELFNEINAQLSRLLEAKKKFQTDIIKPSQLVGC